MTVIKENKDPLLLGIDLGTTSVSLSLVSASDGKSVFTGSKEYRKNKTDDEYRLELSEVFSVAKEMLASSVKNRDVVSVGVTGQMHGIALTDSRGMPVSPFYTWQSRLGERRTDNGKTISDEIAEKCGKPVPTGYGINTFYALRKLGLLPAGVEGMATLPDLFVSYLTGERVVSHPTNASSLGAFDLKNMRFDEETLERLGISPSLLPDIAGDLQYAGEWKTDGRKIPVITSIGDNQAGMFGILSDENDGFINVGTSSQISLVCNSPDRSGDVRPYFFGRYIVSGAGLCGGRSYAILKDFVSSVLAGFGFNADSDRIYSVLNSYAEKGVDKGIKVDTRFCGTRNDPSLRGGITGIGPDGLDLSALSPAFLRGIADELYIMYREICPDTDRKRFAAAGNALRRCPPLVRFCGEKLNAEILVTEHAEEAAFGASLYGGIGAGVITPEDRKRMIRYMNGG